MITIFVIAFFVNGTMENCYQNISTYIIGLTLTESLSTVWPNTVLGEGLLNVIECYMYYIHKAFIQHSK